MAITPPSGDNGEEVRKSHIEKLKDNSLQNAGIAYIIGDAALSTARLLEGDPRGAAGGLLWGMGSLVCAKYGNPSAEQKLKLMTYRLDNYFKKQGIKIPPNANAAQLAASGGIVDHLESFLYAYPSQILNAVYAVGGGLVAQGGLKKNVKSDIACGALIIAGALAGLVIPEKKPDPEHPPEGAFEKVKELAQEKPLRVSSAFYHVNNIFTVLGAFEQKKKNPAGKSHLFRYLTAGSFIFANTMLAMSSKGHASGGEADSTVMEKLADITAQVIAAQAPELREALVQQTAGYLSVQPETHLKATEIAEMLHGKLAEIGKASVARGGWQQRALLPLIPGLTPSP